jgi:hypothetical protein
MEPTSADEAIEVFDLVVGDLLRTSGFKANKERIRTIKDLDGAAIMLREVWLTICSVAQEPEADIRAALQEMDTPPSTPPPPTPPTSPANPTNTCTRN